MTASTRWADGQWFKIVEDLLGEDRREHAVARDTMWHQVLQYIAHAVRLDIGPLNDDEEVRRDIGVCVLKKLEANDFAHLRAWRDRQLRGNACASWWGFIKLVARRSAIDYARTCSLNIGRRGEPFHWVRVEPTDPSAFDDTRERFLDHRSEPEIYEHLERFQASHGTMSSEPPPLPPSAPATPARPRRARG